MAPWQAAASRTAVTSLCRVLPLPVASVLAADKGVCVACLRSPICVKVTDSKKNVRASHPRADHAPTVPKEKYRGKMVAWIIGIGIFVVLVGLIIWGIATLSRDMDGY